MPTPEETQKNHSHHITGLTGQYVDALRRLVNRAKNAVIARLSPELDLDERRRVKPTAANLRALRGIDRMFLEEMNRQGYKALNKALVSQFPGQMPYFHEQLNSITERLKHPLPKLRFSSKTQQYLASQQTTTLKSLSNIVSNVARQAENKALATFGVMPYDELVQKLSDQFDVTVGQSEGLAATALAMYWRSVMAEGFNQIEDDLPEGAVAYYRYINPKDKLTRPFCKKHAGHVRTRAEWEALDNGQGLPVWTSGGGWRCRGHFILDHVKYPKKKK